MDEGENYSHFGGTPNPFYDLVAKYIKCMFTIGCLVLTERRLCKETDLCHKIFNI